MLVTSGPMIAFRPRTGAIRRHGYVVSISLLCASTSRLVVRVPLVPLLRIGSKIRWPLLVSWILLLSLQSLLSRASLDLLSLLLLLLPLLPPNRHRRQPIVNLVVIFIRKLINPFKPKFLYQPKAQDQKVSQNTRKIGESITKQPHWYREQCRRSNIKESRRAPQALHTAPCS